MGIETETATKPKTKTDQESSSPASAAAGVGGVGSPGFGWVRVLSIRPGRKKDAGETDLDPENPPHPAVRTATRAIRVEDVTNRSGFMV
jgi:hypothetical protein